MRIAAICRIYRQLMLQPLFDYKSQIQYLALRVYCALLPCGASLQVSHLANSTVLQISINNYAKNVSRKICMYKIVQAQRWLLKWFEFAVVGKHVACDFRILCRARPWLEECTVAEPAIYNICVRAIYLQGAVSRILDYYSDTQEIRDMIICNMYIIIYYIYNYILWQPHSIAFSVQVSRWCHLWQDRPRHIASVSKLLDYMIYIMIE